MLSSLRLRFRPSAGGMSFIKLPEIREFAFGFSVKTGSIAIAIFGLVLGPFTVLSNSIFLFDSNLRKSRVWIPFEANESVTVDYFSEYGPSIMSLLFWYGLFITVVSLMLLFGVLSKNRLLMLPWMIAIGGVVIFSYLLSFILLGLIIYSLITGAISPLLVRALAVDLFLFLLVFFGLIFICTSYFLVIVCVQYRTIKIESIRTAEYTGLESILLIGKQTEYTKRQTTEL